MNPDRFSLCQNLSGVASLLMVTDEDARAPVVSGAASGRGVSDLLAAGLEQFANKGNKSYYLLSAYCVPGSVPSALRA